MQIRPLNSIQRECVLFSFDFDFGLSPCSRVFVVLPWFSYTFLLFLFAVLVSWFIHDCNLFLLVGLFSLVMSKHIHDVQHVNIFSKNTISV